MLIAHLSDPHLRPRGVLYQGLVDSNAMFDAALRHLAALRPIPDIVLITGDLVDEGTSEEYAVAREMLATVNQPLLVIPGNHDGREVFRHAFPQAGGPSSGPLHLVAANHGPVRIIGFDVTVPGDHHGDADDAALAWLDGALAAEPERPTILMMHQPPFESGIPYIDVYLCRNGGKLAELVAKYPAIERVLCGHIHRFMQLRFGGTMLCTAPSTTTALALRPWPTADAASYIEPPAMLLHHWKPDTGLITHFVPIGAFRGPLAFA